MALTEQEEQDLQTLKRRRDFLAGTSEQAQERLKQPSALAGGFGPREQDQLGKLRLRRAELLRIEAESRQPPQELISQLGGQLPSQLETLAPQGPSMQGVDAFGIQSLVAQAQESAKGQRDQGLEALKILRSQGFTDEQIINQIDIDNIKDTESGLSGRDLPRLIGGFAGGLVALLTFGPDPSDVVVGPFVARLVAGLVSSIGTGAGSFGGELVGQKIAGEEIDLRKAGKGALLDAGIDFSAGIVVNRIGKALAPFRSTIIPEAAQFADDFARVGGRVLPAQLTESGFIDTAQTIAEAAPIGRGGVRKLRQVTIPKQFKQWQELKLDDIAGGLERLDSDRLAPIIDDAIRGEKGTFTVAKIQNRQNYAAIDASNKASAATRPPVIIKEKVVSPILDEAGKPIEAIVERNLTKEFEGAVIDLRPLKDFAQKTLDDASEIGGRSISPSGRHTLQQILDSHEFVGYERAAELNTSFIQDLPALKLVKDKSVALTQKLIQKTRSLLDSPGTKFGLTEEAELLRKHASRFYAENFGTGLTTGTKQGVFQKDVVKQIIKSLDKESPEKLAGIIFKKDAVERIRQTKAVLGNDAFLRLRATWIDEVVAKSTSGEGVLAPNAFLHNINILGEPALKEIFPDPAHLDAVIEIGIGARILLKTSGGSEFAITRGQAVAAGALASGATKGRGRATATALGILGIPKVFSAIIQSPRASKLLVNGLRIGIATRQGASLIARAEAIANEEALQRQAKRVQKLFKRL